MMMISHFVKKYTFTDAYIKYATRNIHVDAFFIAVTSVIVRERKFSLRRYIQRGGKATEIELPDARKVKHRELSNFSLISPDATMRSRVIIQCVIVRH